MLQISTVNKKCEKVPQRFFIIEGGLLSGFQTFVLEKPSFSFTFCLKTIRCYDAKNYVFLTRTGA